ncbi:putative E3 ubiquitin ligase PUB14, partial [Corchorus capsularis]
ILDLDIAVKDGVLGAVGGGGIIATSVNDNVDLKTMVEELDFPEIPQVSVLTCTNRPHRSKSSVLGEVSFSLSQSVPQCSKKCNRFGRFWVSHRPTTPKPTDEQP